VSRQAPRLPWTLARRLDRLARQAHAFHRLAHHPLCERYAGEVVRLGRPRAGGRRICRGCALLALGALAGALLGAAPGVSAGQGTLVAAADLAPLVAGWPGALAALALLAGLCAAGLAPRRGAARPKLLTRFVPMATAVALAVTGLRAGTPAGGALALGAAALVGGGVAFYRRRGPDRGPCQGCPQAPPGPRCDGLRPIARRERAFQRLAGRWIAAQGP